MCDLCSNDETVRANAKARTLMTAEQLIGLAEAYRQMAHMELSPHSEGAKKVGNVARSVVRELVSEWV